MNKEWHPKAKKLWNKNPWGDHEDFPREDWQYEVRNGDTQAGYYDWLSANLYDKDTKND